MLIKCGLYENNLLINSSFAMMIWNWRAHFWWWAIILNACLVNGIELSSNILSPKVKHTWMYHIHYWDARNRLHLETCLLQITDLGGQTHELKCVSCFLFCGATLLLMVKSSRGAQPWCSAVCNDSPLTYCTFRHFLAVYNTLATLKWQLKVRVIL